MVPRVFDWPIVGIRKPLLLPEVVDRMLHVREVEDRNAVELQSGVVQLGFVAHFDVGSFRIQLPLGLGQLARSHVSVVDAISVRPQLVHDFSGEEKRRGRSEEHGRVLHPHAGRAGHVVERAGIAADVVGRAGAHQVRIVRTAVEDHVTLGLQNCRWSSRRLASSACRVFVPKRISTCPRTL